MTHKKLAFVAIGIMLFLTLTASVLDLNTLFDYSKQAVPTYLDNALDNVPSDNQMDDRLSTLGRVLFYDKQLSVDNQTACASCHLQSHGFGDPKLTSLGSNGNTLRHSMRLGNIRFTKGDTHFFWDERANTLENLVTQPIRDHLEMGFSGMNGDPDFADLLLKMNSLHYYPLLFSFAFGDEDISEERMQKALAQFVRSIQSFDSKFDDGMQMVNNINQDFPNFSATENMGKMLYLEDAIFAPNSGDRIGGGLGCGSCHGINPFTFRTEKKNNGLILETDGAENLEITKAPSLRNLFRPDGLILGPFFHDGSASNFEEIMTHYDAIQWNPNLDARLMSEDSIAQNLNLTTAEKIQLQTFIMTLTGSDIFINEKWSDPFCENGDLNLIAVGTEPEKSDKSINVFPNPVADLLNVEMHVTNFSLELLDQKGMQILQQKGSTKATLNLSQLSAGFYILKIRDLETGQSYSKKILKK